METFQNMRSETETSNNASTGDGEKLILIVDDDRLSRRMMEDLLVSLGHRVITGENGAVGVEKARTEAPDLIFLDVVMPVMDGFTACETLKSDPLTSRIPIVLITSLEDRESKLRGLSVGANDFLSKPLDETELSIRTKNIFRIKEFEDFLQAHNEVLDRQVKERTEQLKESYLDTIFKLTAVAEYKDGFTGDHIKKVGHYCRLLAKKLGWNKEQQETIFYSSPMHDIGKVSIPSDILLKPGRLTPEEFALMKTHTSTGSSILKGSTSTFLNMAEDIAWTHHERWDGSGYPRGLKGDEIPRVGMIMNIADQYDALRSERPYKPAFTHDRVFTIITEGDGRTMPAHFDPKILEIFRECDNEIKDIYEEFCS